jgi:nitroreductase
MADVIDALSLRRARRAFDSRPLPPELEASLWRSVSLAPSHGNTQPTRVLVARSPEKRAALIQALAPGNRTWAPAAPLLAAFVSLPGHDFPQENSDGTVREMWAFNSGIAAGNLMAQATALGVLAHPMAGYDEPAVRAVLEAPPDVRIIAVFAIGYPGPVESLPLDLQEKEAAPQERLPLETLIGEDRWTEAQAVRAREPRRRRDRPAAEPGARA